MTILGTRPELIKLSCIINKLDKVTEHILIHTGQNYDYELNQIFFENLKIKRPNYFLNAATLKPMETVGKILTHIDNILEEIKPDAVLILGDTNSSLSAIAVKRKKIPIFHLEAGNRCFDTEVPEEINRKIVDHIADVNLTYSHIARECLIKEGLPPDVTIKVGSPMLEVINNFKDDINNSKILDKLNLKKDKYFVVSLHREENIDNKTNFSNLIDIINSISIKFNKTIIFSAHPRTLNKIRDENVCFDKNVKLIKPLGFFDYIALQKSAKVVLSDSGTISEESSILNFPALNMRSSQERHEAFEEAAVMMVGTNKERVFQCIQLLEKNNFAKHKIVDDYNIENVSDKVIKIIFSFIDFIKAK